MCLIIYSVVGCSDQYGGQSLSLVPAFLIAERKDGCKAVTGQRTGRLPVCTGHGAEDTISDIGLALSSPSCLALLTEKAHLSLLNDPS